MSEVEVHVFPDTLTWMHDFAYSFNDPYTKNYFFHPAFDDYPVVGVNWKQAVAFTKWRTAMMNGYLRKNKQPTLPDFRLPTEAEWEYAAKSGEELVFSGSDKVEDVAWHWSNSERSVQPVGSKKANKWGVHDMSGNVWEWVWDLQQDFNSEEVTNPTGANKSNFRVRRGGGYSTGSKWIRLADRYALSSDNAHSFLGFRLVRTAPELKK